MSGSGQNSQSHSRASTTNSSELSVSDEEGSIGAGVQVDRTGTNSRESSAEGYLEDFEGEVREQDREHDRDTWSEPASRSPISNHHQRRLARRTRTEEDRLPPRSKQGRRHHPPSADSVDFIDDQQYPGSPADLALRQQAGTFYSYTPQHAQGQPYNAGYPPGYTHFQQQPQIMPYGQRQPAHYPYGPYQQPPPPGGQYPFPAAPRMGPVYGHEVAAYPAGAAGPYQQYLPYQITPQLPGPQPIHYHYQPVYTPPPQHPTPPVAAPVPAPAPTPAPAPAPAPGPPPDLEGYHDLKRLLLDEKADREAREAAAKRAQEETQAALEAAKKHAADISKAAETAASEAKTEAEKKHAAEQKKLKEEAEEAAAKAKADAEAAEKKFKEEKEAAVKAAEAAAAAAAAVPPEKQKPIKFKDAVGRKFSFPFHLCRTWEGMEDLIRQAFLHVDVIGPHVAEGHYDLIGPNNEIILPGVWDTVIEPDWTITMHMWPMPEKEEGDILDVPLVPDPPPDDKKKGKKAKKGGGFFLFGAPKPKPKPKGSGSAALAAAAALKKG